MTTHIKIDFDDAGKALHVRVTTATGQTLLPGGTCDLSALDKLLADVANVGPVEVLASVEQALAANQITLLEAARIKAREKQLDAALAHKRTQVADYDRALRDKADSVAIVNKQATLDALTRDVAEVVAIVDKQAALASLDAQVEAKAAEVVALDAEIASKTEPVDGGTVEKL